MVGCDCKGKDRGQVVKDHIHPSEEGGLYPASAKESLKDFHGE